MACRITELVVDCADPSRLAAFWCDVLDYVELERVGDSVEIGPRSGSGGPQPTLVFDRTTEPKRGKLRWHFDVSATDRDQDAELERLLAAGAPAGRHRADRRGVLARAGRPGGQRVLPAAPAGQPGLSDHGSARPTPRLQPRSSSRGGPRVTDSGSVALAAIQRGPEERGHHV